ncbi:mitotic spindle assembly checkpoint protein MAD1-like [Anoplophora glabripennis]|uniref:mitotic spindle assembly checkpoint protein MAD1-like n=1 Tax=Anoplophora glabripennis TaxID=217634 RepID=UPI0008747EBD|nr:mitotic spindle assembly checkpoint protein MAD1-like [Anoplophora glabripennis]
MTESVNDTIMKMVKNLKSGAQTEKMNNFEYTTLKRSISSSNSNESSFDEPTPVKRLKHENKLDLSYVGSPREMRRLRADLVEARNTILNLETRISHMHALRKQMQLMFDEENQSLKRQHEYDKRSIEELENQLQIIRKREADIKRELVEVNNKYDLLKIKNCEQVEKLEKTLEECKEESRQIESEENSIIPGLERKITELESMLEAAEEDAEAQKKLAEELEKRLSEKNSLERDLEQKDQALQKAKVYIKELEYAKENIVEFHEQAKTQAHKLANYVEMEKENAQLKEENVRLKEEVRNKLLLEEEVYDLKNRLIKFKAQEKKLADLQVQETQNAMYLNEWRAVARGICESSETDAALPHLLRSTVERLQQQELTLTSEKVELESQLKTITHEAKVAKAELEKNQKLLTELKSTGDQKQSLIHRMQKKLLLVSRERDSYRLQLDSYEKDLTMCVNTTATGGSTSNQIQAQKDRIENLERMVDGYRDMVTKLENDLQTAQPNIHSEIVPVRAEQISRLQDEIQQLKHDNDKLRERRDELEIQLESYLIGQDTLQGGQAYHLANNPLAECLAQRENLVDKLEQEVEKLKKKLKNMEEGIEVSKLGDISVCPKEVQSLKEQIKSHEQQTQMLKDYFKSQMQEFRNVIYNLLGYKIDRQNSLYKLRSMYSDHVDDQLCFQLNKEGELNLLETEFSTTLEDMINLHLVHQKSIPVFLSAVTMDMFNNKTITKTFQIE